MKHGISVLVNTGFQPRIQSAISGAVFGWSLLLSCMLFQLFHSHGFDDPYITYRYAINVAHGNGFVYNLGVRTLSTTTPLYTLMLVPFAWLGLDLPLVSNAISCLSLAGGGVAWWALGRTSGMRWAGLTGLLLYPIVPLLVPTLGAESALYCALILWGCVGYFQARYTSAALLLSLAILMRADSVLVVFVLGLHWFVRQRGSLPWRALLLGTLLTLPWFAWAWWYFGTPLPVTLATKQHQGQLPQSVHMFAGLIYYAKGYWHRPVYCLYGILAVVGLGYGCRHQRHWLLLPLWNVLYLIAYNMLGVTNYFWYYAPLAVGVVALVALGVEAVYHVLAQCGTRWVMCAGILVLVLLLPEGTDLREAVTHPDRRLVIYRQVGDWLRAHTAPDATVGTLEVGMIGFYSQRAMIDFAGLIQPETGLQLGPTASYEDAAIWATHRFKPQYLVLQRGSFDRLLHDPTLISCQHTISFSDPTYIGLLDVYHCPSVARQSSGATLKNNVALAH